MRNIVLYMFMKIKLFQMMVLEGTVRWDRAELNSEGTEMEMLRGVLMVGFSSDGGNQDLTLFSLSALPLSFWLPWESNSISLHLTIAVMKKQYCWSVNFSRRCS